MSQSLLPGDRVLTTDPKEVQALLNDPATKLETVNELYDFGKLMLDQIRGVRSSYDTKLTSCLGWGTAVLAIMLAGIRSWVGTGIASALASAGTASALLGVLTSAFGLKSWGGLQWPSEKDWFRKEHMANPGDLKRFYVLAMLEAHQSYSVRVQRKGYALTAAEYLLVIAAMLMGAAVLVRQLL